MSYTSAHSVIKFLLLWLVTALISTSTFFVIDSYVLNHWAFSAPAVGDIVNTSILFGALTGVPLFSVMLIIRYTQNWRTYPLLKRCALGLSLLILLYVSFVLFASFSNLIYFKYRMNFAQQQGQNINPGDVKAGGE